MDCTAILDELKNGAEPTCFSLAHPPVPINHRFVLSPHLGPDRCTILLLLAFSSKPALCALAPALPMFFLQVLVASVLLIGRVAATPCVGFDTNSGLYVFGLSHDVSLGPSSGWNASCE